MFEEVKFQILLPYHEETMKHNVIDLNRIGARVVNVKAVDIRDENENKISNAYVLVCVAPLKVYERIKKFYTVVEYREGVPILA